VPEEIRDLQEIKALRASFVFFLEPTWTPETPGMVLLSEVAWEDSMDPFALHLHSPGVVFRYSEAPSEMLVILFATDCVTGVTFKLGETVLTCSRTETNTAAQISLHGQAGEKSFFICPRRYHWEPDAAPSPPSCAIALVTALGSYQKGGDRPVFTCTFDLCFKTPDGYGRDLQLLKLTKKKVLNIYRYMISRTRQAL
jgi:hypothetical protein